MTGELIQAEPPPATVDSIVRQETGNLSDEMVCSYDPNSEEGILTCERHTSFQGSPNETAGMLNVAFQMVAFTTRPTIVKKSADGVRLDEPRLAVRTVVEMADGRMFSSSSSWFFQSLKQCLKVHGELSREKPMSCVMRKAGLSYKLFRITSGQISHQADAAPVEGGRKKK